MNSGLRASISLGVPPTVMSQPSASAPAGETMFSILQYTIGGMCAASVSTWSITNLGVALGIGKPFLMNSWLNGWITKAKRRMLRKWPVG